ncbi:MAG: alpha/beta hydrolase [Bacteroidota bacterium]
MKTTAITSLEAQYYKKVKVNNLTFNVYEEGSKEEPVILLLHGQPASSEEFRYNVSALREAGFRVVIPDLLGCGESDKPLDLDLYTWHKEHEHILGIMDALDIENFDVVGGDRGSIPAWMLIALNPDRAKRLISENVNHLNGFLSSGIEQSRRSWYMLFYQFELAKQAIKANDWALFRGWMEHHPDVDLWIEKLDRPNALEGGVLNWYRANMNPDRPRDFDPLPNVGNPVMIVYSMNDIYIGPEQLALGNQFMDTKPRFERIDGAGHFIARNAPDQFNKLLIDFFKG